MLYVREADGTERVLVDVTAMDPTGLTTLDGWAPSIEGTRLSYKVSSSGDEESRLTIIDVTSGEVLDGPIDRMRFSAMTWLPGGCRRRRSRRARRSSTGACGGTASARTPPPTCCCTATAST